MATHMPVTENTVIAIKIQVHATTKKLKLPLKDLGADHLIPKLRSLLLIRPTQDAVFERYSDSAGGYVILDPANPAVFKTLIRAAKAKLKLRLRATLTPPPATSDVASENKPGAASDEVRPSLAPPMPYPCTLGRGSTCFDQRSVGPGVFTFRESSTIKTSPSADLDEAPVPRSFSATGKEFLAELASHGLTHDLALRTKNSSQAAIWSVYCNACDAVMNNVHFHCSICDGGDYDLCQDCVETGKVCPGEGHWLIKRSLVDGKVVASSTERVAPKPKPTIAPPTPFMPVEVEKIENVGVERDMPGAFTDDARTLNDDSEGAVRTCNSCIIGLPDREFVTCISCDDFDLCRRCHGINEHGHNPAHRFAPAVPGTTLTLAEEVLLPAGRNIRHNAICDGCEKNIYGVRHKCFDCPDFDYCGECMTKARVSHPRHRFAQIYEPIAPPRNNSFVVHHGIYCDGPLCKDKPFQGYIQGVRYKCVVCHDTDFCASCEAVPASSHNKTHPLIKFKTPVNNVTISTQNEDENGRVRNLGDKISVGANAKKLATNVTTPVKTVADIEPSQKDVDASRATLAHAQPAVNLSLEAHFVRDSVVDGTVVSPNERFTQIWTMRNPGPSVWPAGCSVRFVGGDNMLNVDNDHPASVSDINEATESNVIGREVQPGEEVAFKVLLKAPLRQGKSISYWRVKASDGTPFGHKLWCDVNVKIVEPTIPLDATSLQSKMNEYWAGYQRHMAAIRSADVQQEAMMQHGMPSLFSQQPAAPLAKSSNATSYHAQVNWKKQMEEFVRRTNSSNMLQPAATDDGAKADLAVKAQFMPSEPAVEPVKEAKDEVQMKGSQMIFPTLERESPSNSIYQSSSESATSKDKAASVEDEVAVDHSESTPAAEVSTEEGFEDISELEVLSADGEDSEDDGFMTDEEYDILDASDSETVASK